MSEFYQTYKKWLVDPQKLLEFKRGEVSGVYAIDVECATGVLICMYVGETGNVQERILQHLQKWFRNGYVEYWTGVSIAELNNGKIKFRLELLQQEKEETKRKKLEKQYILSRHPYLQYSPFPKYPNKAYKGLDLCIVPWENTRRAAFLARVKELCPKELDASKYVERTSWDKDWEVIAKQNKPNQELVTLIANQIPMHSDIHIKAKKKIDSFFNFPSNKRGCSYPYLVALFAKAYVMECESAAWVS